MHMRFVNSETASENTEMIAMRMFMDPRETRFS